MSYTFLFTGQGAQSPGMGESLLENSPTVRCVFNLAESVTGRDVRALCLEADAAELSKTIHSQLAIFTVSCALTELLKEQGVTPDAAAGFSLGELAAYYAAGVFSLEDGFRIIQARAEAMQKAAEENDGAMAAVLGLDNETVESVCNRVNGYVIPVNYNCPGQLVIAGDRDAVSRACDACLEAGAKKTALLAVNGAFHSRHMQKAGESFGAVLETIPFSAPRIPLYLNYTGEAAAADTDLRKNLVLQMQNPVRWERQIGNLTAAGFGPFLEIGAGKTLTGLLRRIDRSLSCTPVQTFGDVMELTKK